MGVTGESFMHGTHDGSLALSGRRIRIVVHETSRFAAPQAANSPQEPALCAHSRGCIEVEKLRAAGAPQRLGIAGRALGSTGGGARLARPVCCSRVPRRTACAGSQLLVAFQAVVAACLGDALHARGVEMGRWVDAENVISLSLKASAPGSPLPCSKGRRPHVLCQGRWRSARSPPHNPRTRHPLPRILCSAAGCTLRRAPPAWCSCGPRGLGLFHCTCGTCRLWCRRRSRSLQSSDGRAWEGEAQATHRRHHGLPFRASGDGPASCLHE